MVITFSKPESSNPSNRRGGYTLGESGGWECLSNDTPSTLQLPFTVYPGCTAEHSLSLQTDRRINEKHLALARAWDALSPLPAPARVKIVNVRPSRDVALTLLCDAMYRAMTLNGCVTQYDLERTALPAGQIAELAPIAAVELASAMVEFTSVATAARCLDDDLVAA